MAGVARTKFAARLPSPDAGRDAGPAKGGGVVVLLIGATAHHPLGILAPGFAAVGDYMIRMQRDLDARRDEFGLLASSAWLSAERASGNGNVAIMYFRDYAYVPRRRVRRRGRDGTRTDGETKGPAQVRALRTPYAPRRVAHVGGHGADASAPAHLAPSCSTRAAGAVGERAHQRRAQHARRRGLAASVPRR